MRQLSYFLALIEEGHFGRAADRVHVTQPALSMQIKELETNLDVALIERQVRGIRLTRAGREVAARARKILGDVTELEALARRQGLRQRVHLGVIPTVAPYLLPPALAHLRAHGGRDLRVREAQTSQLLAALEEGQLDAIVIATPVADADRVVVPLFEDRFLLAGHHARIAALGDGSEHLRPVALDPDQLLLLDEGHCLADQALEVCALDRRRVRLDLGASSLSTLCGLVGQGMGLTFLPEIALATEGAAVPAMATSRFAAPEPARVISLVRRAGSDDLDWFEELASALTGVGQAIVTAARCQA
ncbi:MAG: LysR substrate-binding domain-containing protein [Rhodobacteraceae bacterium]|nr:LysR substrate-binding domain-containing protein [Paracoccaceae bacterium]